MITIQEINGQYKKFSMAYEKMLQPLCKSKDLPHMAISILLFIANNPEYTTASDICMLRGLKRPIVSNYVEKLVEQGYIERRAVLGDRRKDALVCTEKAEDIVDTGHKIQQQFGELLLEGLDADELDALRKCFQTMNKNVDKMIRDIV